MMSVKKIEYYGASRLYSQMHEKCDGAKMLMKAKCMKIKVRLGG